MRAFGRAALLGVLLDARALADPAPSVRFLPPRRQFSSESEPSKKDARSAFAPPLLHTRMITLFNVHTLEAVTLEEAPVAEEPALLSRFLRDRTNWEEHPVAMANFSVLRQAAWMLGAVRAEVVSGYRSDKLNEHLRKKGHHVAPQSQHVLGNALDFRLVGVPTVNLLRVVRLLHRGGIGNYPGSGFVHIDVGPQRQWRGE